MGQGHTEYDFRKCSVQCQISTSIKVVFEDFAPALTVSEIFTIRISYLEKVERRHGVLLQKRDHSMANNRSYKRRMTQF